MYPSSSSSSSQSQSGLTSYGFTPGSLLTNIVNAVIGGGTDHEFSTTAIGSRPLVTYFFPGESFKSSCTVHSSSDPKDNPPRLELQRSYGHQRVAIGFGISSSALLHQRSRPMGHAPKFIFTPKAKAINDWKDKSKDIFKDILGMRDDGG